VKRADTGEDPDIFDSFYGFGQFGNPFLADIVNAGWLPRAFFEAVGGPGAAGAFSRFPSPSSSQKMTITRRTSMGIMTWTLR
jgi:hypothetical protein